MNKQVMVLIAVLVIGALFSLAFSAAEPAVGFTSTASLVLLISVFRAWRGESS